ncbi:DUF3857 domain-containing protein [Bernardetia sp. OM2101]|uniref:DUF3857 domain-containing protein n=1 Tax=Bernardetia sp. OM2101 TaxID=3344876 RepID=UPI0035D02F1A
MSNYKKPLFLILFYLSCISFSYGQFSKEMTSKFGKVTQEEVEMKSYELYPDAEAIVLFETCEIRTNFSKIKTNEGTVYRPVTTKEVHRRIKIFNKTAFELGNITIGYLAERHTLEGKTGQSINKIKASTYILENGKVEEYELDKKDIYDKVVTDRNTNDYKEISFAIPNIKEGCVIEYSYIIEKVGVEMEDWTFQNSIPTKWSEYIVTIPNVYTFSPVGRGYFDYVVSERNDVTIYNDGEGLAAKEIHLAQKDLPAFKMEKYMSTAKDYLQSMTIEYNSLRLDFMTQALKISTSLQQMAERLLEDENFGAELKKGRQVKNILEAIITPDMDDKTKMQVIHQYVAQNFSYNGKERIYTKGIKKTIDEKEGSSADINLLMLLMLKEANLNVEPMLLSTRGNGKVFSHETPHLFKFDYVVAKVSLEGKNYFLDATQNHLPTGLLPFQCYNGQGWVVNPNKQEWLVLSEGVEFKKNTTAVLAINEEGILEGQLKITSYGNQKSRVMNQIAKATSEEKYIEEEIKTSEMEVKSYEFKGLNELQNPLGLTMDVKINSAESTADLIYFTPILAAMFEENPFKSSKRVYPVDFGIKQSEVYMMMLTIPEGYEIDEMPESIALALIDGKASYSYSINKNGNMLQIRCKTQINSDLFLPTEYEALKSFIDQILSKQEEQIVLKKIVKN